MIVIKDSTSHKLGFQVLLNFYISQHSRDAQLLLNLEKYLDCGQYTLRSNKNMGSFLVRRLSDIIEKIIPFFEKYNIKGAKALDFKDFCNAAEIMKENRHLTERGLEEIRNLKARMNTGRQKKE